MLSDAASVVRWPDERGGARAAALDVGGLVVVLGERLVERACVNVEKSKVCVGSDATGRRSAARRLAPGSG